MSHCIYAWQGDIDQLHEHTRGCIHAALEDVNLKKIKMPGEYNRRNAWLVRQLVKDIFPDAIDDEIFAALASFPGTERRFEKLAHNLYTDYGHTPTEIAATVQLALEINKKIVVVYQPHQNIRQHHILKSGGYGDCFYGVKHVYWLPTYLSREDKSLRVLPPKKLIESTTSAKKIEIAKLDDGLLKKINYHRDKGHLVVLITAGDADSWLRGSVQTT